MYARWVDVDGGVSLSELEDLVGNDGLDRARAVSRRASSRVLVGLTPRLFIGDEGLKSGLVANVEGSILPINVQRFLLGEESAVSFGFALSAVSDFANVVSKECRLYDVFCVDPGVLEEGRPSKPKNKFVGGDWMSFRRITRRRPGAG